MNRQQKLKKLHRNRDLYLFGAIVQFAVGFVFAGMGFARGDAMFVAVATLAAGAGAFTLWRVKQVAGVVERFGRLASGPATRFSQPM